MLITNVCKFCNKTNNGVWVITKLSSGKSIKICKTCSDTAFEQAQNVINPDFAEKNRKRMEAERKAKNAEIVRQLKSNTYRQPPR